jgi:CxxC-x17-CxxC domain-containing protein
MRRFDVWFAGFTQHMYNKPFRNKNTRDFKGGKRFGGGGSDWNKPMHDATCAGCGKDCQVPFRPNGSKPVFCSYCFKKEGNAEPKRFDRGARPERPSFGGASNIGSQLKEINGKLDAIIRSLEV